MEEAAAIQQTSNLEDLYRKILLGRLQEYRRNGSPSDTYLKSFPHLPAYFPRVLDYVSVYPASKDRRIPEFFYWAKEEIGGKNIIQIRHVFSQRIHEDFVMVDHLIYSNHSLLSSAFILHLVNYVDDRYPRTLLVFYGRNYGNSQNRLGSSNKRVFAAFRNAGEELEERYLSRVYPGFPYGLTPSDQR